jgi:predicted alpha/beta-fold hydrolase
MIIIILLFEFFISFFRKNQNNYTILSNISNVPKFIINNSFTSPLLQTFINYIAWNYFYNTSKKVDYNKLLTLKNKSIISLNYYLGLQNKPAIIVIPGIHGDKNSHYIKQFVEYISKPKELTTIIYNKTGIGNSVGCVIKPFSRYAEVDDFIEILEHIKKTYSSIYLVSFSAGGALLVKTLNKRPDLIDKAITIANVFDVNKCLNNMPMIYNKTIAQDYILKCKTIQHFDELYILPYHNYKNLEDYYNEQSCYNELYTIKKPLICINSLDDILCGKASDINLIPLNAAKVNKNIKVIITSCGGHLGWAETFKNSWLFTKLLPDLI